MVQRTAVKTDSTGRFSDTYVPTNSVKTNELSGEVNVF